MASVCVNAREGGDRYGGTYGGGDPSECTARQGIRTDVIIALTLFDHAPLDRLLSFTLDLFLHSLTLSLVLPKCLVLNISDQAHAHD